MGGRDGGLGFFGKRELIDAGETDGARLRDAASAALAGGFLDTALELAAKAGDAAGAERVLEAARAAGDAFTFEAALRVLGRTAAREEWVRLGETALAAGMLSFAYKAFEKADHQPGLILVRAEQAAAGFPPPETA